jgi:flagellar biosynthesis GTPase FlhF
MSDLIFSTALIMFAGYVTGKIFKGFNPFLVAIGLLFLLFISPIFTESKNEYIAYAAFGFGLILNFNQPVTRLRYWLHDFVELISLRRLATNYADNIDQQKADAEAELNRKKREIEEELRRQKREAEEDIDRQRKEAEDAIHRESENFKREQERARSNRNNSQSNKDHSRQENSQSRQDKSNFNHSDSGYLDPQKFPDACEILGKGQGCSLKEYKAAYMRLIKLYHPDKISGLSGARKAQAEDEAKQINAAWNTIKKKLK